MTQPFQSKPDTGQGKPKYSLKSSPHRGLFLYGMLDILPIHSPVKNIIFLISLKERGSIFYDHIKEPQLKGPGW